MEHIVQIAIGVDDQAIRESVEKHAEKQIINDIEQEVRNKLFSSSRYGANAKVGDPLSEYSKRVVEDFMEKHKDEIIDKAAGYLAERLVRTKAAKEAVGKATKKE